MWTAVRRAVGLAAAAILSENSRKAPEHGTIALPASIDRLSRNCVFLHRVTRAESGSEHLLLKERQLVGHVGRKRSRRIPIAKQSACVCPFLCEFDELVSWVARTIL
jgi:hypothetical protein